TGNYLVESTGYGTEPQPNGIPYGSNGFGMVCQDINNDGWLDIYAASISHPNGDDSRIWSDPTQLLINLGPDQDYGFENQFQERNLQFNEGDLDVSAVDFDHDGRLDLTAQRDNKYEANYTNEAFKGWFGLARQDEDGSFTQVGFVSGVNDVESPEVLSKGPGGHAWSDYDHDGDVDLLLGTWAFDSNFPENGRPNELYRNEIGSQNAWLALRLVGNGTTVNRDAIGARVRLLWEDGFSITQQVAALRGQWGSIDTRVLHFGLGDRACEFTIEVTWPDGTQSEIASSADTRNTYAVLSYENGLVLPGE
ncbi:MAG: CRTAC1 family protein, partial [Nannocystaceae bacterium]